MMHSQLKVDELKTVFSPKSFSRVGGKKRIKRWSCRISEMLLGDYVVTPLTSAKMLKSEGYRMNSCCRDYTEQCAASTYSIFSIRSRIGERVATLGLVYDQGSWQFDQCFGPSNSEVMEEVQTSLDEEGELRTECYATELYYVAHEVVRLMNAPVACH